jgi:coenzyme PQQ precursor peptide PqqA
LAWLDYPDAQRCRQRHPPQAEMGEISQLVVHMSHILLEAVPITSLGMDFYELIFLKNSETQGALVLVGPLFACMHGRFNPAFPTSRSYGMAWQTPAFEDIRFGFEVTMYICNR